MISSDVLIKISALLSFVRAVRTLELRLLAALVPRVSQQGAAMLVPFAASLATVRKLARFDRPKRSEHCQVLYRRQHRREDGVLRLQRLGRIRARFQRS